MFLGDAPERQTYGPGTSYAAPVVDAAMYYLRQVEDDAAEVVSILGQCAIDIGAPGVDEEFGLGALNVNCAPVANREAKAAVESVRVT